MGMGMGMGSDMDAAAAAAAAADGPLPLPLTLPVTVTTFHNALHSWDGMLHVVPSMVHLPTSMSMPTSLPLSILSTYRYMRVCESVVANVITVLVVGACLLLWAKAIAAGRTRAKKAVGAGKGAGMGAGMSTRMGVAGFAFPSVW